MLVTQSQLALRSFLALFTSLLLAACSSLPPAKTPPAVEAQTKQQAHLQSLASIEQFAIKGRIGVQTASKGFSGGLVWQHTDAQDDIVLYSPLGGQVASIMQSPEKITLTDAKGNSISADNAENLTQAALGWQLPLTGLADWSLGRPSGSPIQDSTWDAAGHLTRLKQEGWDIEYQQYALQNGYMLPSKVLLKSERVNLKLLIETWSINAPLDENAKP